MVDPNDVRAGCFVVCAEHQLRQSFGFAHAVARAACLEHNAIHHPPVHKTKLASIIYQSHARAALTEEDLGRLLLAAQTKNAAFGITGMLLVEDGWFLQALEGPELLIDDLMRTIESDRRHEHVRVLDREVIQARRFPDWAMAEGHINELEARPLQQYYEGFLLARGQALDAAGSTAAQNGAGTQDPTPWLVSQDLL